jgi:hypothetical protein
VSLTEVLVAVAILVGLVGIVLPILPGSVLILGALLLWASEDGSSTAWIFFAVAATVLVLGAVVKYVVPHRNLEATGVPRRSLLTGAAFALVGFFVVPVVGLFLGFVLGVYVAEHQRVGAARARPSTAAALKAVGVSILVELLAALVATSVWVAGVLAT